MGARRSHDHFKGICEALYICVVCSEIFWVVRITTEKGLDYLLQVSLSVWTSGSAIVKGSAEVKS